MGIWVGIGRERHRSRINHALALVPVAMQRCSGRLAVQTLQKKNIAKYYIKACKLMSVFLFHHFFQWLSVSYTEICLCYYTSKFTKNPKCNFGWQLDSGRSFKTQCKIMHVYLLTLVHWCASLVGSWKNNAITYVFCINIASIYVAAYETLITTTQSNQRSQTNWQIYTHCPLSLSQVMGQAHRHHFHHMSLAN